MRILLHNVGAESTSEVEQALRDKGYEVTQTNSLTVDEILAMAPELLVAHATPSDITCCALISQLKAIPAAHSLKILVIVHGGALERARALDLGADDVISFPFVPPEFAAKVRTQFRQRQPELQLETELKEALERERLAEMAAENLAGKGAKRRYWLIGVIFVLSAATVLASALTVISSRKDALQLKTEVARPNNGLIQEGELLKQVEQTHDSTIEKNGPATRQVLKAQTEQLRKRIAAEGDAGSESLKNQIQLMQDRLNRLETETRIAEKIVHAYVPSVCLLHVVVEFRDKDSGELIHIASDSAGRPLVDENGMASLETGGKGALLRLDFFGTGFLVGLDGRILTNHHVAEPWSSEQNLKELLDRGLDGVISYTAYFPGDTQGIAAKVDRISANADLATLKLQGTAPRHVVVLEIDDRTQATVAGDPVVLIGYPTGIEGILARAGSDISRQMTQNSHDLTEVVSQLAAQQLIRPTITQGHIGDVLKDKIVYDAATTVGGSGGPLFNQEGKVIGVNAAIVRDFGGSNMAVPVRYADELVK